MKYQSKRKNPRKKIKQFIKDNRHNDIFETIKDVNKILIGNLCVLWNK